jgi:catechol 2,3-dioxygenase-like lactoylglutathione lyase family enzyme
MLGEKRAIATIAVKNIEDAKGFYEGILGLTRVFEDSSGVLYQSGPSQVFVYTSPFAGSNKATAATWAVGEALESIIERLKAKGITFETYDVPGTITEGILHISGNLKEASFLDPDGNSLSLVNIE